MENDRDYEDLKEAFGVNKPETSNPFVTGFVLLFMPWLMFLGTQQRQAWRQQSQRAREEADRKERLRRALSGDNEPEALAA